MFPVIGLHKSNNCFSSFSPPMRANFPKNLSLHRSLRPRIDHHPSSPRTASPVVFPPTPRSFLPASSCMRSASNHLPPPQISQPYSRVGRTIVRQRFSPASDDRPSKIALLRNASLDRAFFANLTLVDNHDQLLVKSTPKYFIHSTISSSCSPRKNESFLAGFRPLKTIALLFWILNLKRHFSLY